MLRMVKSDIQTLNLYFHFSPTIYWDLPKWIMSNIFKFSWVMGLWERQLGWDGRTSLTGDRKEIPVSPRADAGNVLFAGIQLLE